MIVLDTNLLSALMQVEPSLEVAEWLDGLPADSVWITAITVFEVRFGIELLPDGRKRQRLEHAFQQCVEEDFERRVLPFGTRAAETAGRLAAEQRRRGRSLDVRDLEIAGIVSASRATLATRNTRHFEGLGLDLIDPFGQA